MNAEATCASLIEQGVILGIRLGPGPDIVASCRAAAAGGLRVLEITLTTPGALEAIRLLAADRDLLVGAGTVLTVEEVEAVAAVGARFVMSPVFDRDVVRAAHDRNLLAIPGAATPAEILSAYRQGARLVKVFPAAALGGPDYLRAIRNPLPGIPLVPTSGPNSGNIADYVMAGAVAVGVGSEVMAPGATFEEIEAAASRVADAMRAARNPAHRC